MTGMKRESQQPTMAADTERIRIIGAHAPANGTHFLVATAVIRYGEFGTETDGKPRKWWIVKNKDYSWRRQKEAPESPFIRLVSKSGHCRPISVPSLSTLCICVWCHVQWAKIVSKYECDSEIMHLLSNKCVPSSKQLSFVVHAD